ncbi:MAG: NAD(P)-binding domain-containing protein [Pseudomonadota bacterium]
MLEQIGVAGCGRMGQPMLAALRDAGLPARGFDLRPPASYGEFAPAMTEDADGFARGLTCLISVVRDIPQTDAVLFGAQGFVTRAPDLQAIVICSTLSPRYVRGLRDRVPGHIRLVDAPMSGAVIGAEERRLSFMLGGAAEDHDALMPLFEAMGRNIFRMGPFGAGASSKVLNNLLAASSTAMTRLVLDWADAAGLDERELLALIEKSSGQNWLASGIDEIEFARDGFDPENSIGILVKDVESALDDAPDGAVTTLPETVRDAIAALGPRAAPK